MAFSRLLLLLFLMHLFKFRTDPSCCRGLEGSMANMVFGVQSCEMQCPIYVGFLLFFLSKYVCVCPNFANGDIYII